jgi:hypothetical protein
LTYSLTSTSVFNISCFSIISCPWFFFGWGLDSCFLSYRPDSFL